MKSQDNSNDSGGKLRILDLFKSFKPKQKQLVLKENVDSIGSWPNELTTYLGIDSEYRKFQEMIANQKKDIFDSLRPYSDENTLAAIPDRARTMSALHGQEFSVQVKKLLTATNFTDVFSFEKEQDLFLESSNNYKGLVAKNVSALGEFFHDELKITQAGLEQLEDMVIKFSATLESLQFPKVRKAKELQQKIEKLTAKSAKYVQLLTSLKQDLARTEEKKTKIEEDMQAQQALIRNSDALSALQKSEKIEQELHDIAAKYVALCDDLRTLFKNNPSIKITPKIKHIVDELSKDPFKVLAEEHEAVKVAFDEAITLLEEEKPGNVKNLITRLSNSARDSEALGRKVATMLPDERALKRDIIKDVAALQVYDKQQFLMRAKFEKDALEAKISFLITELDPNKVIAMRSELKAIAKELGAVFEDEHEKEAGQKDGAEPKIEVYDAQEKN